VPFRVKVHLEILQQTNKYKHNQETLQQTRDKFSSNHPLRGRLDRQLPANHTVDNKQVSMEFVEERQRSTGMMSRRSVKTVAEQ
jgi:hypothetical protein